MIDDQHTSRSPQPPDRPSRPPRYDFFLNPYDDMGFTRCPKCEQKTKLRKFALVIHIEPDTLFVLNKSCRYCTECELIIAHRREVEPLMAGTFESRSPEIVGNDYLVVGTLERTDWRSGSKGDLAQAEAVERMIPFREHLHFEVRGGWGPPEERGHDTVKHPGLPRPVIRWRSP